MPAEVQKQVSKGQVNYYKLSKNGGFHKGVSQEVDGNMTLAAFQAISKQNNKVHNALISRIEKERRDGNTKRSQPLKKIAEIKKAQRKFNQAYKNDPELTVRPGDALLANT